MDTNDYGNQIALNTPVLTTKPNWKKRDQWTDEEWVKRKWNKPGVITKCCRFLNLIWYIVTLNDNSTACYDSTEIEVIPNFLNTSTTLPIGEKSLMQQGLSADCEDEGILRI